MVQKIYEDVFTEVLTITEHDNDTLSLLFNNDFLSQYDEKNQVRVIELLYDLAQHDLMEDFYHVDVDKVITVSPVDAHKNVRLVLTLLVNTEGEFRLLTYFGGKVNHNLTVRDGLLHAAQIVKLLKNN